MLNRYNKLFKRDSQRVAFSLCVGLSDYGVCSGFSIALLTP
ncbi:TPA: DUF3265 domain-containing protein [Vibrio parahaemolyticus]|nr:DUF3265 domain-containing protein [Vibrio parahaemolyticus]HAV1328136.1 DUF3265 domain-containing protein [Vibrio parahaemolyticus]HBN6272004.1 DUF3265 domain-containing protein [Vibrio parahaemolyticus]HCG7916584.1 DUF3265 domain-containing protein [Vibrio parahaemolyticus]